MKNLLPILLIMSFHAGIFAETHTLNGQVRSATGSLPYASVVIDNGKSGTVTNEHGRFSLEVMEKDSLLLTVSYVGYETYHKVLRPKNIEQSIDVVLEEDNELEAVVVTGTLKPTYISQSPVKIEVVTSKKLDTFLPTSGSSIMDGISLVSGVQEVVGCGVCYTNSISINGLPGPYTAVLMDGNPMYGSLASIYGLNGIPGSVIDRFEVIKGPNSTLYGSEAMAGVINIITKNPRSQPAMAVDVMASTHGEVYTDVTFAPKFGPAAGIVGFNHGYKNHFDDHNEDGFSDDIHVDNYAFFTKWSLLRPSGKSTMLAAKYLFEDRRNGVEEFVRNRGYKDLRGDDEVYGESIYTHRVEFFGHYELPTKPYFKLQYSYSSHWQDSYYGDVHYQAQQHLLFANLLSNFTRKNHDVVMGITARYQFYDDNTVATEETIENEVLNKPENQSIPGLFIQDEWKVHSKWTLLGGFRLDYYKAHKIIPIPSFNIKYKPSEWTTMRLNLGTGFRVVNLFTEDHAFVSGQREVRIAESLNPERSYNLSMNVNQVFVLGKGTGAIDLDGYFTYFTNKIVPDYDEPGIISYANAAGHAHTAGASVNITYNFQFPLAVNIGLNGQSVQLVERSQAGEKIRSRIEHAPLWSGVLDASYSLKKSGWTFAYSMSFTGHMALPEVYDITPSGTLSETPRSQVSRPFAIQNIQVTKTFEKPWTLYSGIKNLANFRQSESPLVGYNDSDHSPGFSPHFDTSYAYAPNHGIEFYIGVKWSLEEFKRRND